jgi:hypothetical protein
MTSLLLVFAFLISSAFSGTKLERKEKLTLFGFKLNVEEREN